MSCELVSEILREIAPGLRGLVEAATRKRFVEACEESLFTEVVEKLFGREAAEMILRIVSRRIEEGSRSDPLPRIRLGRARA